jgi:micrococcal nuclease
LRRSITSAWTNSISGSRESKGLSGGDDAPERSNSPGSFYAHRVSENPVCRKETVVLGNVYRRIAALPLVLKVLLAVAALIAVGILVVASPLVVVVAFLVLIVAVIALIFRVLRRRPLRSWGLVALTSLLLLIVFGGITNALYGGGAPQQASSPPDPKEEPESPASPAEDTVEEASTPSDTATETASTPPEPTPPEPEDEEPKDDQAGGYDATVRVTRVVDGDTIRISPAVDGTEEVRLIGVDTPETKEPGCEVQPYGPDASEFTARELQGEEVDLEFDEEREDRYDRLLAYVHKDKEMFNETLLEEGYAQVYIVDPNDEYEDRFEEAQAEAQQAGRGIWALSFGELALLTDRGNGIGGSGCTPNATPPPPPLPSPSPTPSPSPAPTPSPTPAPSAGGGPLTCADFSTEAEASAAIPANPQLDRDRDGRACETLP